MANTSSSFNPTIEDSREKLEKELKLIDSLQKKKNELENKSRTLRETRNLAQLKKLLAYEEKQKIATQAEILKLERARIEEISDAEERLAAEKRLKNKEFTAAIEEAGINAKNSIKDGLVSGISNFKSQLEQVMSSFIQTQEAMSYNLSGTGRSLEEVTKGLNRALGTTGLVRQEEVYKNLTTLIENGIVYNAEQRAFLQTIADDMSMTFDANNGSLTRLINLQRKDLSSSRMAIEYSLKTFLNQNYETSQYIKNGFSEVSAALIEAQAWMGAQSGVQTEAVIQQWLGALSSTGASQNTIQSIATALGQLGSGNISRLSSSNMQNLLVMGAARRGKSYAEILTQGLTADLADSLMEGMISYMDEISRTQSNVVRSEYARIFGLNVSDLKAAAQLYSQGSVTARGRLNDNIGSLLSDMSGFTSIPTILENMLSNIIYGTGTGVASSPTNYGIYKLLDVVGSVGSGLVEGLTTVNSLFGQGIQTNLATVLRNAPLLRVIPSLLNTLGGISLDRLSGNDAINMFNALSRGGNDQIIKAAGLISGYTSQSGIAQSGSMIVANTDTSDIVKGAHTSAVDYATENFIQEKEYYDTTEIYKLLVDVREEYAEHTSKALSTLDMIHLDLSDGTNKSLSNIENILTTLSDDVAAFPTTTFTTVASFHQTENTVTIGNDLSIMQDTMTLTAMNIQNIYNVLYATLIEGGGTVKTVNTAEAIQGWANQGALGWATEISPIGTTGL